MVIEERHKKEVSGGPGKKDSKKKDRKEHKKENKKAKTLELSGKQKVRILI